MKRFTLVFALLVCGLLMLPGAANCISKKKSLKIARNIKTATGTITFFELMYDPAFNEVWVYYYYVGTPSAVTYNVWGNGLINGFATYSDYINYSDVYISHRFADDDLYCAGDLEGEVVCDNGAYAYATTSFEWPDCCPECVTE
ncbi:hypothetical protein EGT74_05890 [Chitinophaga lutea]|uniref:Uncharacterized protein n=1 Tax=Chitinophaga lutea TaxID=2488634 RepID=A0A3N4QMY3_9BACT|nr:hypothetical protein [Chitinophaga lutea]RPE13064.1 hypothetical protein EGT74_05890 [Chitinophaga lutea]